MFIANSVNVVEDEIVFALGHWSFLWLGHKTIGTELTRTKMGSFR